MQTELKRRNLSGIYIFDQFPGEEKRQPTCIEDCTPAKRKEWLMSLEKEALRNTVKHLCDTLSGMIEYLHGEKCVNDEQSKGFLDMVEETKDKAKWNWAEHEFIDQIERMCYTITAVADACNLSANQPEEEEGEDE